MTDKIDPNEKDLTTDQIDRVKNGETITVKYYMQDGRIVKESGQITQGTQTVRIEKEPKEPQKPDLSLWGVTKTLAGLWFALIVVLPIVGFVLVCLWVILKESLGF